MEQNQLIEKEKQFVCVKVGEEEYGFDIMRVREIVKTTQVTPVPHAPFYLDGVINLRGEVLPVANLSRLLGKKGESEAENNRIIVVELKGLTVGFVVDSVTEVLRISESKIISPPSLLAEGAHGGYLAGIAKPTEQRNIIILEIENIFQDEEGEQLATKTDSDCKE